jgi:predicted ATP-grasp superfamily ATP-dependent carboligase
MPLHDGMYAAACRLMRALRYTGVAMVEFRWDPQDDRWIFIEINARLWGSLPLAVASGADFPAALADLLLDGHRPGARSIRTDLYERNLTTDYAWWRSLRRRGEPPTLPPRELAVDGLRPLLRGRERWDTWSPDDPAPWVAEVDRLGRSMLRAVGRRLIGTTGRTVGS